MVVALGMVLVAGCLRPVREEVDERICHRANHPIDVAPLLPPEPAPSPAETAKPEPKPAPKEADDTLPAPRRTLQERLQVPPGVPGGRAPDIVLPPLTTSGRTEIERAINRYFPALPPLGPDPQPVPGPNGQPFALADLQKLALTNSPVVRQAAADVKAAEGAAQQAGTYPNPTAGFFTQSGTPNTGPTYTGLVSQTIKTAGKLKLAEAAGIMDVENARLKLRATEADLFTQVRQNYFAVLVAQENMRATRALAALTDEVFTVMVLQLKAGEVATYEPMQLRVVALQARGALIQARNSYTSAWKQLAASLGLPAMPPTQLAGRVDMPMPLFRYDQALARVLAEHTDVLTSRNDIQKARYNLRQAQVTPIPDVTVQASFGRDYSPPGPPGDFANMQVTFNLPVWDLNRGNILQSQGNLLRAVEEPHKTRDDLTSRLAEAFGRYENGRYLLELYRRDILPNQVQAFRAAVARHARAGEPEKGGISFNDLVTAEQTLVSVVTSYIGALGDQWKAVVDVAGVLQTDDLFQVGGEVCPVAPIPDLEHLLELPCYHPCSPLPPGSFTGANGDWPPAAPREWMAPAQMPAGSTPPASPAPEESPRAPTPGEDDGAALIPAPDDRPRVLPAVEPASIRFGAAVEVDPAPTDSGSP
jgi:cobalt-zinc-cadmium efflux system outer membrane protein